MIDSNDHVVFAIISKPGVLGIRGEPVAVPFVILSFVSGKNELVLDMGWQKFASTPRYDRKVNLENPACVEDIYRYFGVQPYWKE